LAETIFAGVVVVKNTKNGDIFSSQLILCNFPADKMFIDDSQLRGQI